MVVWALAMPDLLIGTPDTMTMRVQLKHGARITSLLTKDGLELLAWSPPPGGASGTFFERGIGGYDDCFPNIAPGLDDSAVESMLPDHGQLWSREWLKRGHSVLSGSASAHLECRLAEPDALVCRSILLTDNTATITVTIRNLGAKPFPYMWAGHLLLAMQDDDLLTMPNSSVSVDSTSAQFGRELDLRSLDAGAPETGILCEKLLDHFFLKSYLRWPIEGVLLSRSGKSIQITAETDRTSDPLYLGLWINRAGFPENRPASHLGIEPSSSSADSLEDAILNGSAKILAPGSIFAAEFRISVSPEQSAHHIRRKGSQYKERQ